ncbi:MAG: tetratricopeptide repeat protein, partial [Acidobacteria bacterium]|nr:tetratricopeptide repeat protein [Acidobacteriota bacterium]
KALADFNRSIKLEAKDAWAIAQRGSTYRSMEQYEKALADFSRAIELDAEDTTAHLSLIVCYRKLGRMEEYRQQIEIARGMFEKVTAYNRACFAAVCGNTENALALLRAALESKEQSIEWARTDPDFDLLREDPRFEALLDEMATPLN